jgi:hypothetical protein
MQDFAAADRATPRYLEKYPAMVHNQTPFYYSRHLCIKPPHFEPFIFKNDEKRSFQFAKTGSDKHME